MLSKISGILAALTLTACSGNSGYLGSSQLASELTVNGIDQNQPSHLMFALEPANTSAADNIPLRVEVLTTAGSLAPVSLPVTVSYIDLEGTGHSFTSQSVSGVASFNVSISEVSSAYTLTATAPGVSPVTSTEFQILPGTAASLKFLSQPQSSVAGVPLNTGLQVEVLDAQGNLDSSSTAPITLAIGGSGVLSGELQAVAVNGVATFSTLAATKVGTGFTLTAISSGLTQASSQAFNISAASPAQLAWIVQPSNVHAGDAMTPAVVQIQDAFGNPTPTATNPITVTCNDCSPTSVLTNATPTSGMLSVPLTTAAQLNGYVLTASGSGLKAAVSNAFNVGPGYATIQLVQNQAKNFTPASTTATVPVNATGAGHLLVVLVVSASPATTVSSVTDNAAGGGNTYTSAGVPGTNTTDGKKEEIWYSLNSKAGATSVTVTYAASTTSDNVWVLELSGADTIAPLTSGMVNSNKSTSTSVLPAASPSPTSASASANGATIPPATELTDSSGNVWTVNGGVVYENGATAAFTDEVIQLLYYDRLISQENIHSNWWSWIGNAWVPIAGDPRPITASAPTVTTSLPGELVVSLTASDDLTTIFTGNSFTALPLPSQPSGAAYLIAPTTGNYGPIWNSSAPDTFAASTVSFKPAKL